MLFKKSKQTVADKLDDAAAQSFETFDFVQLKAGQTPVLSHRYQTTYYPDGRISEQLLYRRDSSTVFGIAGEANPES